MGFSGFCLLVLFVRILFVCFLVFGWLVGFFFFSDEKPAHNYFNCL